MKHALILLAVALAILRPAASRAADASMPLNIIML
jgi:hypothetical protein